MTPEQWLVPFVGTRFAIDVRFQTVQRRPAARLHDRSTVFVASASGVNPAAMPTALPEDELTGVFIRFSLSS